MSVVGINLALSLIVISIYHKINKYLSFAQLFLINKLTFFIPPSNNDIKSCIGESQKSLENLKINNDNNIFEIPSNLPTIYGIANKLLKSNLLTEHLILLPYYHVYEWLFDFNLIIICLINILYLCSNLFKLDLKSFDSTIIWNIVPIYYCLDSLIKITLNYINTYTLKDFLKFKRNSKPSVVKSNKLHNKIKSAKSTSEIVPGENSLILISFCYGLVLAMLIGFLHQKYSLWPTLLIPGELKTFSNHNLLNASAIFDKPDTGKEQNYDDYNAYISKSGKPITRMTDLINSFSITHLYCSMLLVISGFLSSILLFPTLRWVQMALDAIEYSESLIAKCIILLNMLSPIILLTLTTDIFWGGAIQLPISFHNYRLTVLYLHVAFSMLKLCWMRPHLQAYLNLAYDKVIALADKSTKNASKTITTHGQAKIKSNHAPLLDGNKSVSSKLLRMTVNRVNVYLCIVCLQYLAPAMLNIFIPFLLITLISKPDVFQPLARSGIVLQKFLQNSSFHNDTASVLSPDNRSTNFIDFKSFLKSINPIIEGATRSALNSSLQTTNLDLNYPLRILFSFPVRSFMIGILNFTLIAIDALQSSYIVLGYVYRTYIIKQP